MNTFAKIGKMALMHLFSKKEVFLKTRYEELGTVLTMPRKLSVSSEPIDLEKEYKGHIVGSVFSGDNCKVYIWGIEFGLAEIKIVADENEGRLIDLISRTFSISEVPSHIVIATKNDWDENDEVSYSEEEVVIYSLTEEQKNSIHNGIIDYEESMVETNEEFVFKHGYFPVNY